MLYHLLYSLAPHVTVFNVFRYITFRTILATLTALILSLILGPWLIRYLAKFNIGETIREDGPERHLVKKGTPTMGGILILFALVSSTLLWSNLNNLYVWVVLAVTVTLGMIGFIDDYRKVVKKDPRGLRAKNKILLQTVVALFVGLILYLYPDFDATLTFPFAKNLVINLGVLYLLLTFFVIVGASNAVNLTDGLDGLAIFPVMMIALTYGIFSYAAGHIKIATYLQIPYVAGSGELAIFCGALLGAGMGFLWFNSYPASVFMGDTGSLSLGGAIGVVAAITKHEIVLIIAGGIFVVEALSVILQIASFKLTGKRIFKMAPIHHHFELLGWKEPKIIVRFWIIAIILALVAMGTLKLR
jgi:phospho-N-acetylmuramoyl-pentapeptide-transferase